MMKLNVKERDIMQYAESMIEPKVVVILPICDIISYSMIWYTTLIFRSVVCFLFFRGRLFVFGGPKH